MTDRPKLTTPRIRVLLSEDGDPLEVQTRNGDMLAYERTANRHKWPPPDRSPFQFLTFLAWSALRRTKQTELSWDDFAATAVDVSSLDRDDDDGEDDDAVRPTGPGPGTG